MKQLLVILLFTVLIYGCNKDDSNPITSTNQGKSWNLVYSKADSTTFLDTAYMQKIAYIHAESDSRCWVKFSYKSNGNFKFDTKMRNGQFVNTTNGNTSDNWISLNDSSLFNYANYDTLYYNVTPSHTHYVTLKNLEVYIK